MTVVVFIGGIMKIFVAGSKDWVDYNEVMRNLTIVIEDATFANPDDKTIVFVHRGLFGAENMVTEYIGKIDKFMKQKGYSIKEELIKPDPNSVKKDFDIINSGIDKAIIFKRNNCKRSDYCAKILSALEIPTRMVRG